MTGISQDQSFMYTRIMAWLAPLTLACGAAFAQNQYPITFDVHDLAVTHDQTSPGYGPFSSSQLRELRFRVDRRIPANRFLEIRDVLGVMYAEVGVPFDERQISHSGTSEWAPNEDGVIVFRLTDETRNGYAACGWWGAWPSGRVVQFGNDGRAMDRVVIAHELGHCLFRLRHIPHSDYMMCSGGCHRTELWTNERNRHKPWHPQEAALMREVLALADSEEDHDDTDEDDQEDTDGDDPVDDQRGPCDPATDVLDLDGYRVRMCYVTPSGEVGQARSGLYASGQSGLLWFFNRDNAEVLVKVLDGCAINRHRWVFVAPVTDLGLHMIVTSPGGDQWSYINASGKADTSADTYAFACK